MQMRRLVLLAAALLALPTLAVAQASERKRHTCDNYRSAANAFMSYTRRFATAELAREAAHRAEDELAQAIQKVRKHLAQATTGQSDKMQKPAADDAGYVALFKALEEQRAKFEKEHDEENQKISFMRNEGRHLRESLERAQRLVELETPGGCPNMPSGYPVFTESTFLWEKELGPKTIDKVATKPNG